MNYAKVEDDLVIEYPLGVGDIMLRFPGTSFPVPFEAPEGFVKVEPVERPICDYWQDAVETNPVFIDGVLTQQWIVEDASDEEVANRKDIKAGEIRRVRNSKLSECDWTQLPDSTADKEAWAEYRQELRDITLQDGFPWEIDWPENP